MKRIGCLTSGWDAEVNAAIRAVFAKHPWRNGGGLSDGYAVWLPEIYPLMLPQIGDITRGGISSFILLSYPELHNSEGQLPKGDWAIENTVSKESRSYRWWRFYHGAMRLTEHAIPAIGASSR